MSKRYIYYGSTTGVAGLVTDNLFLNWNFADAACYSGSGTDVLDLTANNNDGTQTNATYNTPYFDFDGTSRIAMPFGSDNFNFLTAFTIQGWFKFDKTDLSQGAYIVAHWAGSSATQKYRIIAFTNGKVGFYMRRADTYLVSVISTVDYGDDAKHFFSAKWDGSNNITITFDDTETITVSGATSILDDTSGNTEYRLGENDIGGNRLIGSLGWNLVYTDELTTGEETQNYNATIGTFP